MNRMILMLCTGLSPTRSLFHSLSLTLSLPLSLASGLVIKLVKAALRDANLVEMLELSLLFFFCIPLQWVYYYYNNVCKANDIYILDQSKHDKSKLTVGLQCGLLI